MSAGPKPPEGFPVWNTPAPHSQASNVRSAPVGPLPHPMLSDANLITTTFDETGCWTGSRSGPQSERTWEKVSSQPARSIGKYLALGVPGILGARPSEEVSRCAFWASLPPPLSLPGFRALHPIFGFCRDWVLFARWGTSCFSWSCFTLLTYIGLT